MMNDKIKDFSRYDYEERAAGQDPSDFWGQVRRTINGKPVGEDQIQLICNAIKNGLELNSSDNLIDIGCGNGALTHRFKDMVNKILGVDRSEYLIDVANENFRIDSIKYLSGDALQVLRSTENIEEYNKILIYGVFSFFDDTYARQLFDFISNKTNVSTIFIGNVRDRSLAEKFYKREIDSEELDNHQSSMGVWRQREYFQDVCNKFNWDVKFSKMPEEFYAREYYFDAKLFRLSQK